MFLALSLCLGWQVVSGETMSSDAPSPRERVIADLADGRLNDHDLFTASIIVSGATHPTEIEHYQRRIERMAERLRAAEQNSNNAADDERLCFRLLDTLHREVLTGEYVPGCGDLRRALDIGDYNCATSTILFQVLARQKGLRPVTIGLPGHVRIKVNEVTLETTDAKGRLAGDAKTRTDSQWESESESERVLTDVQLIAKLIYNQGLEYLARRNFEQSLAATELSWQLDPGHDEARQNVAAVVNNWALQLSSPGTYHQAIQLLRRGQEVAPNQGTLSINEQHVLLAWWAQAVADNDFSLAENIRETTKKRYPSLPMK